MSKAKKPKQSKQLEEADSVYFLKIVLYIVLAATWIRFETPLYIGSFPLPAFPVGLFLGFIFASHDHFQVDRKIEYAVLIVVTIMAFYLPIGIIV